MKQQKKTCQSCAFVEKKIVDPRDIWAIEYVCRCMPPTPCVVATDGGFMIQAFFPPVSEKMTCSQWKNYDSAITKIK